MSIFQERRMQYENVPASNWQGWTAENEAVILDVREPHEWALGTLPGSTLMSMRELPGRIREIDQESAVLCVCRSGSRSAQVAAFLSHNGYTKVANMTGGLKALGMQR